MEAIAIDRDKDVITAQDQEDLKDALLTLMNSGANKMEIIDSGEGIDNSLPKSERTNEDCAEEIYLYSELSTYEQALARAFNLYQSSNDDDKIQAIIHFPEARLISLHRVTLKKDKNFKAAIDGICNKALAQAIKIVIKEADEKNPPFIRTKRQRDKPELPLPKVETPPEKPPKKRKGNTKRRVYRCAECIRKHSKCRHGPNAPVPPQPFKEEPKKLAESQTPSSLLKRKRRTTETSKYEDDSDKILSKDSLDPESLDISLKISDDHKRVSYEEPPDFDESYSEESGSVTTPTPSPTKKLDTPREKGTACLSCRKLKVRCNGTHRYCEYRTRDQKNSNKRHRGDEDSRSESKEEDLTEEEDKRKDADFKSNF